MNKLAILFIFLFPSLFALVDLEKDIQPFVLKTEQIKIEGFPDAFNPSIIRLEDQLLMIFRSRDPLTNEANVIALIWLDLNFKQTSKPQILNTKGMAGIQDPRLIIVDGKLYITFSAMIQGNRRMGIAELLHDGNHFFIFKWEPLLHFEGDERKFEKNWVPFAYNDYFLLSYSIFPHRVFLPLFGEQKCLTVDFTNANDTWKWGEIRGGTQAFLIDNQYLGFFHSSIQMSSVQSNGKAMQHYFMGAYTFENSPPFHIKQISSEPIVGPNFYNGQVHKTWKPLRVVFPGGYVYDDRFIWVAYGRQDHEIWVVKIEKKGLLNSLIPINKL